MLGLGIVGCNFGRLVQLPAFRSDPRCRVVALAGTDAARTRQLAVEASVAKGYGDWQQLLADPEVEAVAIAVPPDSQPAIAIAALSRGKPVFAEKPLAADLAAAQAMAAAAQRSGLATMIDFEFIALPAWRQAKLMIDEGAIGRLRHVFVTWAVENQAVRRRQWSWKTDGDQGGGVLGNFVSHSLYYLEWFAGAISGLSARIGRLPDADVAVESMAALTFSFASGASGSLSMSCAAYCGSGHRIEFYGTDGTLVLVNTSGDYMRNFVLLKAHRPDDSLTTVAVAADPLDASFADGRIAPVARLASHFLDACERKATAAPSFEAGLRVQELIDTASRSHAEGRWIEVPPPRKTSQ